MTPATRTLALLPLLLGVACTSRQPPHVVPASAPPAPASLPALPRPPPDAGCRVTDQLRFGDVAWKLRTRLDAVPAFVARTGSVTAWLLASWRTRSDGPVAVVQLENDALELRALVAAEDLRVVIKTPFVALSSVVPDGVTDRSVLRIEEGSALLELDLPQRESTGVEVPCGQLGLARRGLDASALLPKARRRASLAAGTQLVLASGRTLRVNDLATLTAGEAEVDVLDDTAQPLVAFHGTCGGLVFGRVAAAALRPLPTIGSGTNARCPNTGDHIRVLGPKLSRPMQCKSPIPLFVRTGTLEDGVGVLKPQARFQLDEPAQQLTVAISVRDSPVELLAQAHFSIRRADLASCRRVAVEE
jgi:hypothetical protein